MDIEKEKLYDDLLKMRNSARSSADMSIAFVDMLKSRRTEIENKRDTSKRSTSLKRFQKDNLNNRKYDEMLEHLEMDLVVFEEALAVFEESEKETEKLIIKLKQHMDENNGEIEDDFAYNIHHQFQDISENLHEAVARTAPDYDEQKKGKHDKILREKVYEVDKTIDLYVESLKNASSNASERIAPIVEKALSDLLRLQKKIKQIMNDLVGVDFKSKGSIGDFFAADISKMISGIENILENSIKPIVLMFENESGYEHDYPTDGQA